MAGKKVKDIVAAELEGFLSENGYELYNVEFVKEGRDWFLRVYIDLPDPDEYVGTENCEKVSRYLSEVLDEKDPIAQNYYLEVSSPGMDRALIRDEDYDRYAGRQVEVSLYSAINGRKKLEGTLKGLEGDEIVITDDSGEIRLPREKVAKTKLAVIF
ncbi:MAG: ribosome maturation factor RimP [Firmicutes bacterium]|nr:ribosome maturation factor RimP [Bacillota bacterium]